MQIKFKIYNAQRVAAFRNGYDLEHEFDDMDSAVDFLDSMHQEEHQEPLEWKVRHGLVSADDQEGRYFVIVPIIGDE